MMYGQSVHSSFSFTVFFLNKIKDPCTASEIPVEQEQKAPFKILYKSDVRECDYSFKIHEQIMQQCSFVKSSYAVIIAYAFYSKCHNDE